MQYLHGYLDGFIYPNGFHVNGDQSGSGLSDSRGHPFTLEGNFLAMQAVQEMLLQSWGGQVRIFPALPSTWKDVSFEKLRAEGGYIVSAERTGGHTVEVNITATKDGWLRLLNPFNSDAQVRWSHRPRTNNGAFKVYLHSHETLKGVLLPER